MKKISVIIPMYYEEKVVNECYKRVKESLLKLNEYSYEMIFVNDGSKDRTLQLLEKIALQDNNVKIISFSRNFGHQAAVTAGLKYVTGDAVVIMDADLQDPPELIGEMLQLWEKGNDVIYGKRKKRDGENVFKLFTAKMFYKVLNSLSDVDIPQDTGDFRLVDRSVVDTINQMSEHNKFLRGLFSYVGYNQVEFQYERKERIAGKTKYSLKKMFKLSADGIFGFSNKPIKIIWKSGIIFEIIAVIVLIMLFIKYRTIYTCIISLIFFGTGLQLIAIGIIGEYISRIYDETRQRPQYIIDKKINLD